MASTSNAIIQCTSSSSSSSFEYDVFVSFRGEDTRNSFTGFLFEALKKQGIEAFKDDKDIRKGESIAPELIRAIEGSHVFLVVFSKDYASSTWCLRELAHIWDCIQKSPRHLLPIFYDVDPSQVRKQSGDYEKAFAQHQQSSRFEDKEIKTWREVLNDAADNVEAIFLIEKSDILRTISTMRVDVLSTMSCLKLLKLDHLDFNVKINFFSGTLVKLSNELGYLGWEKYPFECLPPSFEPDKLVELILPKSNIKQLWEGTKPLPNLRRLDLSGSKNLIKMPYIGDALYLESLDLEGCIQLEEIGLSIVLSPKLTSLNLRNCKSLIKLPQFGEDLILEKLLLGGCQKLRHIDPSIGLLKKLRRLNLKNCKNLVSLPNSILGLNSLEDLNLSGCSKLYNTELLYELRDAEQLKKIDIDGAPIHFQSTSSYSREHKKSVSCLMPSSPIFPCMLKLDLSFCNLVEIPDAIGIMCCLQRLDLSGNNFATLPNLKKLSKLVCLKLQHCKQLKSLPELPSRIYNFDRLRQAGLYIFNCPELVDRERCTDMAFSWTMQSCQVLYLCPFYHVSRVVSPGSEIPRWFNNEHEGNCVSLDASPVMHDHNWIGVAFCAIFVVPHETLSAMSFSETEGNYPDYNDIPVDFYEDVDLELVLDKSDHMWLFFVGRGRFIEYFHLKHKYLGRLLLKCDNEGIRFKESYAEVKKYGYRWNGRLGSTGEIEENEGKRKKGIMSAEGRKNDATTSQKKTKVVAK
ncbi:Disease resistance protein RPP2B [Glycine soja]